MGTEMEYSKVYWQGHLMAELYKSMKTTLIDCLIYVEWKRATYTGHILLESIFNRNLYKYRYLVLRVKKSFLKYIFTLIVLNIPLISIAGNVEHYKNPDTSISSWQKVDAGFSIRFIQLLPDFVTATYSARGLPSSIVHDIERYCVFGTIIRNESPNSLSYHVSDWYYTTADTIQHPIKTKTDWINEWNNLGVAFRWSILPDNQRLEIGDWTQGFTTLLVKSGAEIDINYSWRSKDELYKTRIKGLKCAVSDK